MADGTPTLALTSVETANVATNLIAEALNNFPAVLNDDMAIAVALACIVDNVEEARPGSAVRRILRACLDNPNGGLKRG